MSRAATMFGRMTLGPPWPLAAGLLLRKDVNFDTLVRIFASPDGRLIFIVNPPDGSSAIIAKSPPLIFSGISDVRFVLKWDLDLRKSSFTLYDSIEFESGVDYDVEFPVPERIDAGPPQIMEVYDLLEDQEARRVKVARVSAKLPLFSHAEQELEIELRQLRGLIQLARTDRSHVRGVINIVRKLITGDLSRNDKLPLLLLVAGKLDRPLVVFGDAGTIPKSVAGGAHFEPPSPFRLNPTYSHRFKMDIERWLARNGAIIDGDTLVNQNCIKAIADKIGAHVDLTTRKTVDRLSSGYSLGHMGANDLEAYVINLGVAVHDLAVGVLQSS